MGGLGLKFSRFYLCSVTNCRRCSKVKVFHLEAELRNGKEEKHAV